ncbi:MtN3 and saliva related transmembrane protein [Alteromonadaceae bacterium 2753L.S.0a.02]|nr:MtN3 and saliva related transmembrane protein [Alteromonadaceae bacterium 2753L.S.0a.02]
MPLIDVIGYVAACCTTASFLPQVIKVLKTRDTHSLSLGMYVIFNIGVLLWLCYGIMRDDPAIIAANAVTFTLAFIVLVVKINNTVRDAKTQQDL